MLQNLLISLHKPRVLMIVLLLMQASGFAQVDLRAKFTVRRKYECPFVVESAPLKRLIDTAQNRFSEKIKGAPLHVIVKHSDGSQYETDDREYVLHDPNPSYGSITSIEILAVEASPILNNALAPPAPADPIHQLLVDSQLSVWIKFSEEGTEFSVNGASHDWVSDTSKDIVNGVGTLRRTNYLLPKLRGLVGVCFAVLLFVALAIHRRNQYDRRRRAITELGAPPTALIHYVIKIQDPYWQTRARRVWLLFLCCTFLLGGFGCAYLYQVSVEHLFPRAVFAIGDQLPEYEALVALRNNLFWALGVGFLISLAAGVALTLILGNKETNHPDPRAWRRKRH